MRRTSRPVRASFLVAAAVAAAVSAPGATSGPATEAKVTAATETKRYAYEVQATFTLTREAVDPATSARISVERRVEGTFTVWALATRNQVPLGVHTRTSDDYVEVQGKATARVSNGQASPPCEQTVEASGRVGLKFATINGKQPITHVILRGSDSRTVPRLPCAAPEIERWENGTRGKGEYWSQVNAGGVWYESRTKFLSSLYAKLANGSNAELSLTIPSARQQAGVTEQAVVHLVFTRKADKEPKPPSGGVVIKGPAKPVVRKYSASAWFVVWRGGEATGMSRTKSKCTGRFASGSAGLETPPQLMALFGLEVSNRTLALGRANGGEGLVRLMRPYMGQRIALVSCSYYADGYVAACGRPFRAALELVVDGTRTFTRRFTFTWKDPKVACTG